MKLKSIIPVILIALGVSGFSLLGNGRPETLALIPWPVEVERESGNFEIKQGIALGVSPEASAEVLSTGRLICEKLEERTGIKVKLVESHEFASGHMGMKLDATDPELKKHGPESYRLEVGSEVTLVARDAHGFFNAGMTLLQLITREGDCWVIPKVRIFDYPRFPHRGLHLDPARRFLDMDFVKRYVDLISQLKLNVLHFHLVEDQGWRLEIKKYPELTNIEKWPPVAPRWRRAYGKCTQGFYTQDDVGIVVRDIHDRCSHSSAVHRLDVHVLPSKPTPVVRPPDRSLNSRRRDFQCVVEAQELRLVEPTFEAPTHDCAVLRGHATTGR